MENVQPFNNFDNLGVARNTLNNLVNPNFPKYKSLETSVTFVGTTNANGDFDGTGNPSTLFSVTGLVEVSIFALVETDLAGAGATIEIGTETDTDGLIAQTTATDLDAGDIWHDASPDNTVELTSVITRKLVSEEIEIKVGTANITAGKIKFIVYWSPISSDGNVVIA
jgi:hypothetical protein